MLLCYEDVGPRSGHLIAGGRPASPDQQTVRKSTGVYFPEFYLQLSQFLTAYKAKEIALSAVRNTISKLKMLSEFCIVSTVRQKYFNGIKYSYTRFCTIRLQAAITVHVETNPARITRPVAKKH